MPSFSRHIVVAVADNMQPDLRTLAVRNYVIVDKSRAFLAAHVLTEGCQSLTDRTNEGKTAFVERLIFW